MYKYEALYTKPIGSWLRRYTQNHFLETYFSRGNVTFLSSKFEVGFVTIHKRLAKKTLLQGNVCGRIKNGGARAFFSHAAEVWNVEHYRRADKFPLWVHVEMLIRPFSQLRCEHWKKRSWWSSIASTYLSLALPILSVDRTLMPPSPSGLSQLGKHLHVRAGVTSSLHAANPRRPVLESCWLVKTTWYHAEDLYNMRQNLYPRAFSFFTAIMKTGAAAESEKVSSLSAAALTS